MKQFRWQQTHGKKNEGNEEESVVIEKEHKLTTTVCRANLWLAFNMLHISIGIISVRAKIYTIVCYTI